MTKLLQMFEEPNGGISSTRVIFVLWFTQLSIAYFLMAIRTNSFPSIPETAVALSMAFLGQKWAQRREETKKEITQ